MREVSDAELVDRLLSRDEGALREVMSRYGPSVYGMARRVIADSAHAEEVAQDTFVALWRRPGSFDPQRGSLPSFLLGVARNKAVDLVRREQVRRTATQTLLDEAEADADRTSTAGGMDVADDRAQLATALRSVSREQRDAIVLAFYGGRTYREVAQELSIPEGTAKTRLRDGLNKLRTAMTRSEQP